MVGLGGEAPELGAGERDAVDGLAVLVIARLAEPPASVNEIALGDVLFDIALQAIGKDRDLIPIRDILPIAVGVFLAVVCADGNAQGGSDCLDLTDAANELKFSNVTHVDLSIFWAIWPVRTSDRQTSLETGASETRNAPEVERSAEPRPGTAILFREEFGKAEGENSRHQGPKDRKPGV